MTFELANGPPISGLCEFDVGRELVLNNRPAWRRHHMEEVALPRGHAALRGARRA